MSQNNPQDPGSQQPPPGYQPQQGNPQPDYQQQGYQQPSYPQNDPQGPGGYPAAPYGQGYGAPAAVDPGRTLGIVGLILSFFTALIGMIISIVAFRQSKKAGFKNTPALVGIIVGAAATVITIISIIVVSVVAAAAFQQLQQVCEQLGPGEHTYNGTTFTCPG